MVHYVDARSKGKNLRLIVVWGTRRVEGAYLSARTIDTLFAESRGVSTGASSYWGPPTRAPLALVSVDQNPKGSPSRRSAYLVQKNRSEPTYGTRR